MEELKQKDPTSSSSSSREGSGRVTDSDILVNRNNIVIKVGMVGEAQVIF